MAQSGAYEQPVGPAGLLDGDDAGGGLAQYWRVLRRYVWSVLVLTILGGVVGAMVAVSSPSVFRADTRLLVQVTGSSLQGLSPFEPIPIHWLFFETQQDIITSRAVAEDVVRRLKLDEPSAPGKTAAPSPPRGLLAEQMHELETLLGSWRRWVPEEWREAPKPPPNAEQRRRAAVQRVQGALIVEGGRDSEVIVVGYQSTDPREAAQIVNAVADAYIDFGLSSRRTNVRETGTWLRDRLEELRQKLSDSEDTLRAYQAQEGMVGSANRDTLVSTRIDSLTKEQIKAATARSQAEATYRELSAARDGLGQNSDSDETLIALLDSPIVIETGRNKARLDRRISELTERYGEKHPKMIAARAELAETTRLLSAQVNKALAAIRNQAEVARAQEARLTALIDAAQADIRSASGKAFRLAQLEREVESSRKLYETFLDRFKEADISDNSELSNVRVIDRARTPVSPFKPNRQRIVMLGILAGLALGVVLALLRDHLDGTLKTRDDLESLLALPVLGTVPRLRGRAARNVAHYLAEEPRSHFAEAINDVRTGITLSDVDHPPQIVLISSATSGEGKTTLAANLAACFARRGPALLIDGDLRRGEIENLFGLTPQFGLSDFCSGDCVLEQVLCEVPQQPGLSLLPRGGAVPNPLEVLSSQRFRDALAALRDRYEHIVIDSSPVLPVSDAIVMLREVDCVVLTVRAESTTKEMASDALKRILSARVEPVGAVLQQADVKSSRSYSYGYGNYYQYGGRY